MSRRVRGRLKTRHPRGGGEDYTLKGINKNPALGYGGRRGTGLRLPGPVSLPPPRNEGAQEKKSDFTR